MVVAHEILLSALGLGIVSILDSWLSTLDSWLSILESRFSILDPLFYSQVPGPRSQVLSPKSQVPVAWQFGNSYNEHKVLYDTLLLKELVNSPDPKVTGFGDDVNPLPE